MDIIVLKSFIPETFLSVSILFQLVFNIRVINNLKYNFPIIEKETVNQTFFILVCLLLLFLNLKIEGFFSNFLFVNDEGSRCIKIMIVLVSIMILGFILKAFVLQSINFFEYFTIFLLSLFSLLLLLSCSDLISFYLTLEMQSLCFYILSSFKRDSSFSTEAGLKYFISGAFISGVFLFGCTLIYGTLGTLNLNNLNMLLLFPLSSFDNELAYFLQIGIICITTTLLFKIACAPFHFWSPDVYDGAPLSSTIIFSILPKLSLFYFFIKWILSLNNFFEGTQNILLSLGVFSTLLGTFYALSQKRLKKLIIYSSIAQIGFLVSGVAINSLGGNTSVLFFLIIYLITSILIWGYFTVFYVFQNNIYSFYNKETSSLFISSLTNFFKINSLWAFSFVIIFFSIGGIPPLMGFLSKVFVLFELVNSHYSLYAALFIIISSISAFYYIRIIKIIFFEPKQTNEKYEKFQIIFYDSSLDFIYVLFSLLLFLLILLFFFPTSLTLFCQYIILNITSF